MMNAPSPPSSHSPLAAANRRSLDGVARLYVNEHKRARAAGRGGGGGSGFYELDYDLDLIKDHTFLERASIFLLKKRSNS
jgi:hypothetical protein